MRRAFVAAIAVSTIALTCYWLMGVGNWGRDCPCDNTRLIDLIDETSRAHGINRQAVVDELTAAVLNGEVDGDACIRVIEEAAMKLFDREDATAGERIGCLRILGSLPSPDGHIDRRMLYLAKRINNDANSVRAAAYTAVGMVFRNSKPNHVVPATVLASVIAGTRDASSQVRLSAAFAAGELTGDNVPPTTQLIHLLGDVSPGVREQAVRSLGKHVAPLRAHRQALHAKAMSCDPKARLAVGKLLLITRPDGLVSSELVIERLQDEDNVVRRVWLDVSGRFECLPDGVVHHMGKLLNDADPNVQIAACHAIWKTTATTPGIELLREHLKSGPSSLREYVLNVLSEMDIRSLRMLSAEIEACTLDESVNTREIAKALLDRIVKD